MQRTSDEVFNVDKDASCNLGDASSQGSLRRFLRRRFKSALVEFELGCKGLLEF